MVGAAPTDTLGDVDESSPGSMPTSPPTVVRPDLPPPPSYTADVVQSDGGAAGPRWGLGDVFVGILLFFAVQVVVGAGLAAAYLLIGGDEELPSTLVIAIGAPAGWLVMIGWPVFVSRRKGSGRPSRDLGLVFRWVDVLIGIGGGLAALAVSVGLALTFAVVAGEDAPTNTDIIPTGDVSPLLVVLVFLVVAIGTPIAEEIFFRGLVLGAARRRWGTVGGVLFSSIVFGAFHVQPEPIAWLFIGVVTTGYGVVFAMTRVWTQGRLCAPIAAHMVVNGAAVLAVIATG